MRTPRILLATVCLMCAVTPLGWAQAQAEHGRRPPAAHGGARGEMARPAYHRGPAAPYGRGPGAPYGGERYAHPPAYGTYRGPYGVPGGEPYEPTRPDAGWRQQQDILREGVRGGQLEPLGRVIANIRRVTPGRQVDAGIEYLGSRMVYRVRWVTRQGRRIDYYVDAATGAILAAR